MTDFQPDIFDLPEGERRKTAGMAQAADPRKLLLNRAREVAFRIGMADYRDQDKGITTDEIWSGLLAYGLDPTQLGNAWGSIWRGEYSTHWHRTAELRKSHRKQSHAHAHPVWKWRP